MNSIDDIFKPKWEYTYAWSKGIISIDSEGDCYSYIGTNPELKGKNIEIVSNNVFYCPDINQYYFFSYTDSGESFSIGMQYNKAVRYNEDELIAITKDNRIVIVAYNFLRQKISEEYLNDKISELNNIQWKDIKNIGNIIFFISDSNEYYLFDGYEIISLSEFSAQLSNIKIKNIFYNYFSDGLEILTEDGNLIVLDDEINTVQVENEINSIDTTGQIIRTTDEEYYVILNNEDGNYEVKSVKEINSELENKNIVKAEDGTIITEDGNAYAVENGNIQNINNYFNELDGKKVIESSLGEVMVIVTVDGELYINTGEELKLLANNIKEVKLENNILKIINSQGEEGTIIDENLFFPNQTNNEYIKMPFNLKGVKKIIGDSTFEILLNDGTLYGLDINNNSELIKLNDWIGNGKKINYINEYGYIIDEDYNIYKNGVNITNSYPNLKENKVEQISDESAIINGGKLILFNYTFSEEAKNEIDGKKFIKLIVDRRFNYIIDSEGKLYYLERDYGNDTVNIVKIEVKNIKVIDIGFAGGTMYILSEDGKVYKEINDNEYECLSDDSTNIIYQKKIQKISVTNGLISCIDENGNKYDWAIPRAILD